MTQPIKVTLPVVNEYQLNETWRYMLGIIGKYNKLTIRSHEAMFITDSLIIDIVIR